MLILLKGQLFHYFIVMFKKRNLSVRSFFLFYNNVRNYLDNKRQRRYFSVYNFYLGINVAYFPFFIYEPIVFIEDYFLLGMLDYAFKARRDVFKTSRRFIYKRSSQLFVKPLSKLFTYNTFNVRIH